MPGGDKAHSWLVTTCRSPLWLGCWLQECPTLPPTGLHWQGQWRLGEAHLEPGLGSTVDWVIGSTGWENPTNIQGRVFSPIMG